MKKVASFSFVVSILAASQAFAEKYFISYVYTEESVYTATKPLLDPEGRVDPYDEVNGPSELGYGATPINGTGLLDTDTGTIVLDPIDMEMDVAGGSIGYLGWSMQFNGSFTGNTWVWESTDSLGGILVCEFSDATACTGAPVSEGSQAAPLGRPQDVEYVPPPNPFVPGTYVVTPLDVDFTSLDTGGTALYFRQEQDVPQQEISINITIGKVAMVPVPATAWLFGSGLLGLLAMKRKRFS